MLKVLETHQSGHVGAYTYVLEHKERGQYVLADCALLDLEELELMFEDFSDEGLRLECGIVKRQGCAKFF